MTKEKGDIRDAGLRVDLRGAGSAGFEGAAKGVASGMELP